VLRALGCGVPLEYIRNSGASTATAPVTLLPLYLEQVVTKNRDRNHRVWRNIFRVALPHQHLVDVLPSSLRPHAMSAFAL